MSERGDSGKMLQRVQRRPFAGQNGSRLSFNKSQAVRPGPNSANIGRFELKRLDPALRKLFRQRKSRAITPLLWRRSPLRIQEGSIRNGWYVVTGVVFAQGRNELRPDFRGCSNSPQYNNRLVWTVLRLLLHEDKRQIGDLVVRIHNFADIVAGLYRLAS